MTPGVPSQLRIALRVLARQPAYTVVVVVSLALGIALCSAAFSVVNGVLLRPLPYRAPGDLFQVWASLESPPIDRMTLTPAGFMAWRQGAGDVADVAAHNVWFPILSGTGRAERLRGLRVTPGFFELLGVAPVVGGGLLADHGVPGNHRFVILGHGFWQRGFGGERSVIGRTITLDDEPYLVIGVMPAGFRHPDPHRPFDHADVFAPLVLDAAGVQSDLPFLRVVARLRPGVAPAGLEAELHRRLTVAGADHTSGGLITGVRSVNLRDEFFSGLRRPVLLLLLAAAAVLVIVVTNVTNLVLVRAQARRRESAVRMALGATTRNRLLPLLWEGAVLAAAGAAIASLVVFGTGTVLQAFAGRYLPVLADVRPDAMVLLFVAALAFVLMLVLATVPLLATRDEGIHSLLTGADGASGARGGRGHGLRKTLGTAEIAIAVALAIGTALLTRSFVKLNAVDHGFGGDALAVELIAPAHRYGTQDGVLAFYDELEARLASLPGATGVGRSSDLPLVGQGRSWQASRMEGDAAGRLVDYEIVGPGYFDVVGIPVLAGRGFVRGDAGGGHVVAVNEGLARRLWPGEAALGRRMVLPGAPPGEVASVVGIVGDVRDGSLAAAAGPRVYFLHGQWPERRFAVFVQGDSDPALLAAAVRREVAALDPAVPILTMHTLAGITRDSMATPRLAFLFAWGIGALALALAILGVYGILSFITGARTHELGIRVALGATPGHVVRLVFRDALGMIVPGVAMGVAIDMAATRVLLSLIYGIGPLDPPSFILAPALIVAAGVMASYVPARRATGIEPVQAMRSGGER